MLIPFAYFCQGRVILVMHSQQHQRIGQGGIDILARKCSGYYKQGYKSPVEKFKMVGNTRKEQLTVSGA